MMECNLIKIDTRGDRFDLFFENFGVTHVATVPLNLEKTHALINLLASSIFSDLLSGFSFIPVQVDFDGHGRLLEMQRAYSGRLMFF